MEANQEQPYRPAPAPLPSGNDPSRQEEVENLGWNWGGFLLPYLWLVGHGQVSAGLFLLLSSAIPFVSLLHLLLYPLAAVYLGLNGHSMSWRNQPCHSVDQLRLREREWIIWGVAINLLVFLGLILGMIYLRTFLAGVYREVEDLGW